MRRDEVIAKLKEAEPALRAQGVTGLYLFGFTYLYVAFTLLANLDSTGGGFFYGFVAVCALVFSGLNFWRPGFGDSGFGVIWISWAWKRPSSA